jgi:ADP-dependent phosphofructokinase/glucokinase
MAAARELREELGISRISVHTREYVLSVIKDFIPAQLEVEALATGVDVAASLASTGRVAPLFQNDLPLNPKGVEILRAFCKDLGASKSDQGAYLSRGGQSICMVPTRFVEKPRVVVGLGDAFTAAAYACEVAFLRK